MTGLLLATLLAANDCPSEVGAALGPERQAAACAWWRKEGAPRTVERARLEEIYARPEFSRARQRNQGALDALLRRLRAWVGTLFESRNAETYSALMRLLVLLGAAGVAGWALVRVLVRRSERRPGPARGSAEPAGLQLDDPAAHLSRARARLSGDPREALREGLLGLLSLLERRRLARPDRARTNRELARELPARGAPAELTQTVEQLLAWYDRSFYSLEPVVSADAARFLDDVERLGTE